MFKKSLVAMALAFTASTALATDTKVSGFGNAIFGDSDTSSEFHGIDASGGFGGQSSLGVQLDVTSNERVSATSQFVYKEGADGESETVVDYAFVKYKLNESLGARVGKLRTPLHLDSESIYVGQNTPWVTAPTSVYNINDLTSHLGLDATWTKALSSVNYQAQLFVGKADSESKLNFIQPGLVGDIKTTNLKGVSVTATGNDFVAHGTIADSKVAFSFDPLYLTTYSNVDFDLASNAPLLAMSESFRVISFGGKYEISKELEVQGEYAQTDSNHPFLKDRRGFYVTGTYFIDKFELGLTYASTDFKPNHKKFGDLQEEYKATLSYNYTSSMKLAAEYTLIDSATTVNPNFSSTLTDSNAQIATLGMFITF